MSMNSINTRYKLFLYNRRKRAHDFLVQYLNKLTRDSSKEFGAAIHYVVLNGGKRLRPLLVYAVGKMYGADLNALDVAASALELIHTFSLVHDDLPAMDNDDLRRGKPTCHIMFDEATAILVGDVLSIAAFQVLSESKFLSATQKVLMIQTLTKAAGAQGMANGQYIDLHVVGKRLRVAAIEKMYLLKTGALIGAAVRLGALAANVHNKKELLYLEQFAQKIGLAFQIQDDILNIVSTATHLGKNVGTDKAHNKITYPVVVGMNKARAKVKNLWQEADTILQKLAISSDKSNILQALVAHIMQRDF